MNTNEVINKWEMTNIKKNTNKSYDKNVWVINSVLKLTFIVLTCKHLRYENFYVQIANF